MICKLIQGYIVYDKLTALNLVIVKSGERDVPGLTNTTVSWVLSHKRDNRI